MADSDYSQQQQRRGALAHSALLQHVVRRAHRQALLEVERVARLQPDGQPQVRHREPLSSTERARGDHTGPRGGEQRAARRVHAPQRPPQRRQGCTQQQQQQQTSTTERPSTRGRALEIGHVEQKPTTRCRWQFAAVDDDDVRRRVRESRPRSAAVHLQAEHAAATTSRTCVALAVDHKRDSVQHGGQVFGRSAPASATRGAPRSTHENTRESQSFLGLATQTAQVDVE